MSAKAVASAERQAETVGEGGESGGEEELGDEGVGDDEFGDDEDDDYKTMELKLRISELKDELEDLRVYKDLAQKKYIETSQLLKSTTVALDAEKAKTLAVEKEGKKEKRELERKLDSIKIDYEQQLRAQKEAFEESMIEKDEMIEMLTLDHETAQLQAEELQEELRALKDEIAQAQGILSFLLRYLQHSFI